MEQLGEHLSAVSGVVAGVVSGVVGAATTSETSRLLVGKEEVGETQSIIQTVFIVLGGLLGLAISFVALATLCDAWLTPWLQAAQRKLNMSDDLAGVTLMAFGGAAPEIMISTIAVLSGNMKVGFGLLCGSAIIAFGFIPPYCFFHAGRPLELRAFPIVRDTATYLVALGAVSAFIFADGGQINIYESSGLLVYWIAYVLLVVFTPSSSSSSREAEAHLKKPIVVHRKPQTIRRAVAKVKAANRMSRGRGAETAPLVERHDDEGEGGERPGAIARVYLFLDSWFDFAFSYTIPKPPAHAAGDNAVAVAALGSDASGLVTSLGCFMAFAWLTALSELVYELVLIICDSTTFLSPTALGAILLAVGSQAPDTLGAAAMAKAGIEEGAISSALASQVVALTVGFGLPWTIYIGMGNAVVLAADPATYVVDGSMLGIVVLVALFFLGTTLATPSDLHGPNEVRVRIDAHGAWATLGAFSVGFAGLIVLEAIYQEGLL